MSDKPDINAEMLTLVNDAVEQMYDEADVQHKKFAKDWQAKGVACGSALALAMYNAYEDSYKKKPTPTKKRKRK